MLIFISKYRDKLTYQIASVMIVTIYNKVIEECVNREGNEDGLVI